MGLENRFGVKRYSLEEARSKAAREVFEHIRSAAENRNLSTEEIDVKVKEKIKVIVTTAESYRQHVRNRTQNTLTEHPNRGSGEYFFDESNEAEHYARELNAIRDILTKQLTDAGVSDKTAAAVVDSFAREDIKEVK